MSYKVLIHRDNSVCTVKVLMDHKSVTFYNDLYLFSLIRFIICPSIYIINYVNLVHCYFYVMT